MSSDIRHLPPAGPVGPMLCGGERAAGIYRAWTLAAAVPVLWGVVVFGWRAGWLVAVCLAGAMGMQKLISSLRGRCNRADRWGAARWGMTMAMLLYATMPTWLAFVLGAGAVAAGALDARNEPRLHPVVWVRVLLLLVLTWAGVFSVAEVRSMETDGAVLKHEALVLGDVTRSTPLEGYRSWWDDPRALGQMSSGLRDPLLDRDAVEQTRITTILGALSDPSQPAAYGAVCVSGNFRARHGDAMSHLVAMRDVAMGFRFGMIGEVSVVGILLAGLFLVYRGYVRLKLVVGVLAGAAITAAAWPLQLLEVDGATGWHWFAAFSEGADVGLVYLGYQLLGGVVLLGAFFLATEMRVRPVVSRVQFYYGLGCGAMFMLGQMLFPACPLAGVLGAMVLWSLINALWIGVSRPMRK